MKNHIIKFSVLVCVMFLSACKSEKPNTNENDSSIEESFYLGQNPPGLIPEVFAPGVVSVDGRFESTISFSPDLKELYFEAKHEDEASQIYFSKLIRLAYLKKTEDNLNKTITLLDSKMELD